MLNGRFGFRGRRTVGGAALAAGLVIAGCSLMPKHSVTTSQELREHPINQIYIFEPSVAEKIRRIHDEDYGEMQPQTRSDSASYIRRVLVATLSASLSVDSTWEPSHEAREWGRKISEGLSKENVPVSAPQVEAPFPAVLLVGVIAYGTELDQWQITPLPLFHSVKPWRIGKTRWDHMCDLETVLINPRTGKVLLEVRDRQHQEGPTQDQALLDAMTKKVAAVIAEAFPPVTSHVAPAVSATTLVGSVAAGSTLASGAMVSATETTAPVSASGAPSATMPTSSAAARPASVSTTSTGR